jgi:hypothetical protein
MRTARHRVGRWRCDEAPDPGVVPGGIRDRAMRVARARGPQVEDQEKTRASKDHWKAVKERAAHERRETPPRSNPAEKRKSPDPRREDRG